MRTNVFLTLIAIVGFLICEPVAYAGGELDANLDDLTKQITQKMGEKSKKKIAVVEFSDLNGNITDFGRYLSEALITRLVNGGKFEDVIERKLLSKIISEHKLSLTDIVDPSSAKQLGKILGVDAIVSGTVTDLGSRLEINARLVGTEKGSIFAAASVSIAKDDSVNRLLSKGVDAPALQESTPSSSEASSTGKPVVAEGFKFRAVKCNRNNNNNKVICTVAVENTRDAEDRLSLLFENSGYGKGGNLYDNLGNKYPAALRIGNNESRPGYAMIVETFVPNLPVNVQFIAENVLPEATEMTVVISIQFFKQLVAVRNIPITK